MTEQKTIAEQSFMELLAGLKSSVEKLSTLAGKPIHLHPLPILPSSKERWPEILNGTEKE